MLPKENYFFCIYSLDIYMITDFMQTIDYARPLMHILVDISNNYYTFNVHDSHPHNHHSPIVSESYRFLLRLKL